MLQHPASNIVKVISARESAMVRLLTMFLKNTLAPITVPVSMLHSHPASFSNSITGANGVEGIRFGRLGNAAHIVERRGRVEKKVRGC